MQLRGLEECCKSQRVRAETGDKRFLVQSELKTISFLQYRISRIFVTGDVYTPYTPCMSTPPIGIYLD